MNTITIIGAGNMGGAIAQALLDKNFCTPESLCIADSNTKKLNIFERRGCPISENAEDFVGESDIIILAVKPQGMESVLRSLSPFLKQNVLLVSLAAGCSVSSIQKFSQQKKVMRVMPNTPALLGMGLSGYYADSSVSLSEKEVVQKMLNCFGMAVECSTEDQINAITALSGSGPAYYFRILEITIHQAKMFGFSDAQAKEIALQTLRGAGELAFQAEDSVSELREKVTSKGGTTAAALSTFSDLGLGRVWSEGIQSAYKRAQELS